MAACATTRRVTTGVAIAAKAAVTMVLRSIIAIPPVRGAILAASSEVSA